MKKPAPLSMDRRQFVLRSAAVAGALSGSSLLAGQFSEGTAEAATDGPYTPYAQPVDIHVGWFSTVQGTGMPAGQTQQDNIATRFIQKTLNVNFVWDFLAPQANNVYDQKVALVLASGQIPDVMWCTLQEFHRLADAGLLADLTSVMKQYPSPYLKSLFAAAPRSLAAATIGGQLRGIPDTPIDYQYDLLWVRQDWLNKVNMPAPKTVTDIAAVAQAFIKAKLGGASTIGLVGPSGGNSLAAYNASGGFDTLMQNDGAFAGVYLRKGGKVVYGSTQPEMKTALATLSNLYKQGVIDQQFASRSATDATAQITGGKAGMVFAPWWAPFYPFNNAVANDPKADWRPFIAPLATDGKMHALGSIAADQFLVVRKGFAHPEAIMKVLNVDQDVLRGLNHTAGGKAIYNLAGHNGWWQNIPLLLQFDYVDVLMRTYRDVVLPIAAKNRAMAGHFDPTDPRWISSFDTIAAYLQHPDPVKNNAGYALWASYMLGVGVMGANPHLVAETFPLDYYPTPTMLQRQSTLQSLEQRTLFGIVTGQYALSQFDSFVTEYNALGGKTILQELTKQLG